MFPAEWVNSSVAWVKPSAVRCVADRGERACGRFRALLHRHRRAFDVADHRHQIEFEQVEDFLGRVVGASIVGVGGARCGG